MAHNKDYEDYIHSEAWYSKREEAFKIHGRSCKKCGGDKRIHVHHKTYANFKNENAEIDLVPLCKHCHKKVHKFCRRHNLPLFEGTDEYLKSSPQPQRIKKKKNAAKRLWKHWNKTNQDFGRIPPRGKDIPLERQISRIKDSRSNQPLKKKVGAIDYAKMATMYGISEEDARNII